jgi:hypothetical protein
MDLEKGNPMLKPQTTTPAVAATGATTVWTNGPTAPPINMLREERQTSCTHHLVSSEYSSQLEDIMSR